MFIEYKVESTRRLFLNGNAEIEEVKQLLSEDPTGFINDLADRMGIVDNDEYIIENERIVLDEEESTIWLYDCGESEATSPDWENVPPDHHWPPLGCNEENQFGRGWLWDTFQVGVGGAIKLQVQRIDEPTDSEPLESDDAAEELAKLAGLEFDE